MPSWLSDWVGTDMAPLAYYALVALIVLVLIVIVLSIAKKVLGSGSGTRVKGRGPRLAVMDVSVIDPKRKLVLVRRDEVEHLLLIGGHNDLVVEAGILRVPAGARQGRAEPSMPAEPDFSATQRAQPVVARVPAGGQPAAHRGASPLTRPVPRPAPAALSPERIVAPAVEPVSPVVAMPQALEADVAPAEPLGTANEAPSVEIGVEAPRLEPQIAPPVVSPIEDAAGSAEPALPSPSVDDAIVPVVPAPVAPSSAPAPVPRANTPTAPMTSSEDAGQISSRGRTSGNAAAPRTASPAPAVGASSPLDAPVVAAPAPAAPVRQPIVPVPGPERVSAREAAPREPSRPASATPQTATPPVVSPRPFAASIQRTTPSAEAPSARAPLPATTAYQPRSMATPTLPVKPTVPVVETPAQATAPEPAKSDDETRLAVEETATQSSTYDASAEPTPEAVLAKLFAKATEAPATAAAVDPAVASERVTASGSERAQGAPAPVAPSSPAAPETGERRPLSVRSFASAIQGRQAAVEKTPAVSVTPATVVRQEPRVEVPFVSAQTRAVEAPSATFVEPMTGAAKPTPAPLQPATSWEDEEDDLEDFLSAQLNDDLGEDIWNAKDPASDEAPAAANTVQPVIDPPSRDEAPVRATETAVATPARRQLTLEEEMERLLGDFDLETADRRIR